MHGASQPLDKLEPVATTAEVKGLIQAVRAVYVSQPVKKYAIDLVHATRQSPDLRLGASPRATLQLVRAARAHAALSGARLRDPRRRAGPRGSGPGPPPCCPACEAQGQRRLPEQALAELVRRVPVPDTK